MIRRPAVVPQRTPKIPETHWSHIAARSKTESLRDLAAEYGVSHETIRAVVRRVGYRDLLTAAD